MKRITLLVAVVLVAGCTPKQDQDAGEVADVVSSLHAVDVSSLMSSEAEPKSLAGEEPEASDISATSDVLMNIGAESVSNLSEVDRFDRMDPSDKLMLSDVAAEVSSLSEVDASVKSISDADVEATDIGGRGSELVTEVQSSVSNFTAEPSANKTELP